MENERENKIAAAKIKKRESVSSHEQKKMKSVLMEKQLIFCH